MYTSCSVSGNQITWTVQTYVTVGLAAGICPGGGFCRAHFSKAKNPVPHPALACLAAIYLVLCVSALPNEEGV